MTGGTNSHNDIGVNTLNALHNALKRTGCRAHSSDTKIRIRNKHDVRFYYPEVSIVCEKNSAKEHFQDKPVLIAEVLSPSTRRIDDGEKRDAYLTIPSLQYYLLIEQDAPDLVVYRRTETGFDREIVSGINNRLELLALKLSMSLADIFSDIQFVPE